MTKTLTLLIIEDNLKVVSLLLDRLSSLPAKVSPCCISRSHLLKQIPDQVIASFDLILLDQDDGHGGSFHCLNFKMLNPDRIIGISSVARHNQSLRQFGITRFVTKDYHNLDPFLDYVTNLVAT